MTVPDAVQIVLNLCDDREQERPALDILNRAVVVAAPQREEQLHQPFVFFGLVAVTGTTFVQTESLAAESLVPSLLAAIGVGLLACAILVANNLRDIATDREAGKRTLAVLLGDERTRVWYALLLAGAVVALATLGFATTWWTLLGLVFVPVATPAARAVLDGAAGLRLVPVLQRTGISELAYAVGLAAGLLIGGRA